MRTIGRDGVGVHGRKRSWAAGATAAAAAVATALGGCGGASAIDPVAQAAQTTQRLPGVHLTLTTKVSGGGVPQPVTISGSGFASSRTHEGQLDFDFSKLAGGTPGTAEFRFKGLVLYFRFPALANRLPNGKTWLSIDEQKASKSLGLNLSQLSGVGTSDPNQYLNYLRAVAARVKVGSETVRGVATTHYRATIDLSRVAAQLPGDQRAAAQAAIANLERATGTHTVPMEVWIDAGHRIRRLRLLQSARSPSGGTIAVDATVDYISYGPTPAVVAPPANQVFDATAQSSTAAGQQPPR